MPKTTQYLRVLVACEFSGRVRNSFTNLGHFAKSCDWAYDTELPGEHHRGDVREILNDNWDLMIGHPDCTYLANSGVQWLTRTPQTPSSDVLYGEARWTALDEAATFFLELKNQNIPAIALENPIPHRYALERIGERYSQIVQPYEYGEKATKATCLWLKNLPLLTPTKIMPKHQRKAEVHLMAPGAKRAHERSRTYWGIARAMATQWTEALCG